MQQKIDQQFNRHNISKNDFIETSEYLERITDDPSDVINRALLSAAIISYARPFTNNDCGKEQKSTNTIQIKLSKALTKNEVELHNKIIQLRNECIAHSSYDRKPTSRVNFDGSGVMTWSKPFNPLSENIDITLFKEMTRKLENYCINKLFELSRK